MKESKIHLTDAEREAFLFDAHCRGMSLSTYLRDRIGLPRVPLETEIGQASWLKDAIRAGYSYNEMRKRAAANGVTLKEACEAVTE